MKQLLLVLFLLPMISIAQIKYPIDSLTKKITFTEVISSPLAKEILYARSFNWLSSSFRSSDVVKDKASGLIKAKLYIKLENRLAEATATVIISVQEGSYKYLVTDFFYPGRYDGHPWPFEKPADKFSYGAQNYIITTSIGRVKLSISQLKNNMKAK